MKHRLPSVPAVVWTIVSALLATVVLAWVPSGPANATPSTSTDTQHRMQLLRLHPH